MSLRDKVEELNQMVLAGNALEAFDRFYAENVSMQEGSNEPFVGKAVNRKREEDFFASITEFRGAEVKGVTVGENLTMVLWTFDYTHAEWGEQRYDQVAIQWWEDGLIVKERFIQSA